MSINDVYNIKPPAGVKSSANSTTTPLSANGQWEGDWENITPYAAITISAGADVAGTLYADFNDTAGEDGKAYRAVKLSNGLSGSWGIHTLIRIGTYFRVRVVNGSTAQAAINVETLYNYTPMIAQPTSRAAQVVNDFYDVINVRVLSDIRLDEANGKQADRAVVQKFGSNPAVGAATLEYIWNGGGTYTGFITAASAVRIKSGGNANDTAAGSGAQSVTVVGLDENWEDASETIVTAGASQSSATTTTFIRIYRVYVQNVGTYGGNNTGDITIETTGSAVVAVIGAGKGQTQMCIYSVPAGKSAFVRRLGVTTEGQKNTTVEFYQRQNADDVSAPYTGARLFFSFHELDGHAVQDFGAYIGPFPSRTDLWAQAVGPTGGTSVSATMDIVLVTAS